MLNEAIMESLGQIFSEESNVRLHDPGDNNIIVLVIGAVFVALPLLLTRSRTVRRSLALDTERFRLA